jgi:predicted Zn-dependent protease with MMP-like domain
MAGNTAALARRARNQRFTMIVRRAVGSLPEELQSMLDNVAIVVEEEPTADHYDEASIDDGELFGLYQGIPLTDRDSGYNLVAPDRIVIFAGPLERACRSRQELVDQVRITLLHELGHHFGFDEDGLDALGLA